MGNFDIVCLHAVIGIVIGAILGFIEIRKHSPVSFNDKIFLILVFVFMWSCTTTVVGLMAVAVYR